MKTILLKKENKDFYNYLDSKHLKNTLLLSSKYYFFYGEKELSNFSNIVNSTELNNIRYLNYFLYNLQHMIKYDTSFFGCFVNNKKYLWK